MQAARMEVRSITIVNDAEWLGGQFSSEAFGAERVGRGACLPMKHPIP